MIKISLKLNSKSEKDPDLLLINIFVGRRQIGFGKLWKVGTGLLTFDISSQQIHFIYSKQENFLTKMHFDAKKVKFQNPVPCVARTASLGNEFFAKCELPQEKEYKDMSSVWYFWKGFFLPTNQSTWLIDWEEINRIEKRETFYLAAVVSTPAPRSQSPSQIWVQIETFWTTVLCPS